jgi:WD40 repeat protein
MPGHAKRADAVRFADADRFVLSASMDGTARVWDAATGVERYRLLTGAASVCGMSAGSPTRRQETAHGHGFSGWPPADLDPRP